MCNVRGVVNILCLCHIANSLYNITARKKSHIIQNGGAQGFHVLEYTLYTKKQVTYTVCFLNWLHTETYSV